MRHSFLPVIFALLLCADCLAQDSLTFAPDFGKFRLKEFEIKKYEKDTTAGAIVLFDLGRSHFDHSEHGFDLVFEKAIRIKILSKAGLEWANFQIPFYIGNNDTEVVSNIEGYTHNMVNNEYERIPLDVKTIYEEKYNQNWNIKKIAMPNVKTGSIVEIRYTITSPYFYNFRDWTFQKKIPVLYSEYVTKMIPFYTYNYKLQGAEKFDEFKSYKDYSTRHSYRIDYKDMVYSFVMKDVPAFKDEAYITCPDDYLIKLTFQISEVRKNNGTTESVVSTWPKLIDDFRLETTAFGGYLKDARSVAQKQVETMNIALVKQLEQAKVIDAYLKSNFDWDGYPYLMYHDQTVKAFIEKKSGSVSEINLYYVALLQAAGLDAFPVILSTRDHGRIQVDYPFKDYFNYVIAAAVVDGKYMLFDATEPFAPFGTLPARCINDKGLAIKQSKDKIEWVNLESSKRSTVAYNIDLTPDLKTDSLNGSFRMVSNGFDAIDQRRKYTSDPEDFKKSLLSSDMMLKDTIKVTNLFDPDKALDIRFSANLDMNVFDNKISISPFCSIVKSINPLKQPARTYPVDMAYKHGKQFSVTIHIPEGYKILQKQEDVNIDNDHIRIIMMTNVLDDLTLKISGNYEFKKEIYPVESYDEIKEYFQKIVSLFNEEVVLEKIKSS